MSLDIIALVGIYAFITFQVLQIVGSHFCFSALKKYINSTYSLRDTTSIRPITYLLMYCKKTHLDVALDFATNPTREDMFKLVPPHVIKSRLLSIRGIALMVHPTLVCVVCAYTGHQGLLWAVFLLGIIFTMLDQLWINTTIANISLVVELRGIQTGELEDWDDFR